MVEETGTLTNLASAVKETDGHAGKGGLKSRGLEKAVDDSDAVSGIGVLFTRVTNHHPAGPTA